MWAEKDETRKEILTRESIITDLKCRLFKEIIELVLALFLIPLTSYFVVNVIASFTDINQNCKYIIFLVCSLVLFSFFIYSVVKKFS